MVEFLIFTDGGGFKDETQERGFNGVSAFLIFRKEDQKLIYSWAGVCENRTGAWGEIKAIALALETMYKYCQEAKIKNAVFHLITDSKIYYKSMSEWVWNWLKKAKKDGILISSSGQPVVNQEEILEAHFYRNELNREHGQVKFYHINSHVHKSKVKQLKQKFEKSNMCTVTEDEFLFLYLQNKKCDELVKEAYEQYKNLQAEKQLVNN